jgi:AraC-like DNA-binding protein
MGWSFEWHDFEPATRVEWGKSFHPQGLEVCLNLSGAGHIATRKDELEVRPESAVLYLSGETPLTAWREAGQRHQFLTAEFSVDFLRRNLPRGLGQVRPFVQRVLDAKKLTTAVDLSQPLTPRLRLLVSALRSPPVSGAARTMWFTAKVYEVAAELFFDHTAEETLFCTRQTHVAQERVEKAAALVRANLAEPLTLEELGQRVGCSPFYLSRTFTEQMGMTISQFLRQVRLERAADLLRSGKFNVTQAALEVGYSSVGHFSTAFHETFGCCPGLYPLQMPSQQADKE